MIFDAIRHIMSTNISLLLCVIAFSWKEIKNFKFEKEKFSQKHFKKGSVTQASTLPKRTDVNVEQNYLTFRAKDTKKFYK